MSNPVLPPSRPYKRARLWTTFERQFEPVPREDGGDTLIWEPWEVPKGTDRHYWWTVLDPMTSGQLYLAAGFHFVNRLGYIRCANPWAGAWSDHPEYLY